MIICNLHGGLGNQLFQAFYVSILNSKKSQKVIFLTGSLHNYKVIRDLEINDLIKYSFNNSTVKSNFFLLSKIRIAKILNKLKIIDNGIIKFFNITLIDDYCTDINLYTKFDKITLDAQLAVFQNYYFSFQKKSFISPIETIYHLRLTDYFKSTVLEEAEIDFFLNSYYNNFKLYFVTDNEPLLDNFLRYKNVNFEIISTLNYGSIQLFYLISSFNNICTNKSTLSLWASIIYNRTLISSNIQFVNFKNIFSEIK